MAAKGYVDGGARGNPGPAGIGVVILLGDDAHSKAPITGDTSPSKSPIEISEYIGDATNNIAEYKALIACLKKCGELGIKNVTIHGDSELIIKQMNGLYKVKHPNLKPLYSRAKDLASGLDTVRFVHVPRSRNSEADRLVNEAIDSALQRGAIT